MLDAYDSYLRRNPVNPGNILELGTFDGGSLALWVEALRPRRAATIDLSESGDSPYFEQWRTKTSAPTVISTHWGVSQDDGDRIIEILSADDLLPLSLVIDDASHLHAPTRASFNLLFPLLEPGGLYVIEDWSWDHQPSYTQGSHLWRRELGLSPLVNEITRAIASGPAGPIAEMTACLAFVAVRRDDGTLSSLARDLDITDLPHTPRFDIADLIYERDWPSVWTRGLGRLTANASERLAAARRAGGRLLRARRSRL